jgi:hypothetical protein
MSSRPRPGGCGNARSRQSDRNASGARDARQGRAAWHDAGERQFGNRRQGAGVARRAGSGRGGTGPPRGSADLVALNPTDAAKLAQLARVTPVAVHWIDAQAGMPKSTPASIVPGKSHRYQTALAKGNRLSPSRCNHFRWRVFCGFDAD